MMLEGADCVFGFTILIVLMEKLCVLIFLKLFFFEIGDVAILASCDLFAVFCSPKRWKNWQVSVRYVRRNRF